jgi:transposase
VTDEEWSLAKPEISRAKRGGNKFRGDVRQVINGLMDVLSAACRWRAIPRYLPPRSTDDFCFCHDMTERSIYRTLRSDDADANKGAAMRHWRVRHANEAQDRRTHRRLARLTPAAEQRLGAPKPKRVGVPSPGVRTTATPTALSAIDMIMDGLSETEHMMLA